MMKFKLHPNFASFALSAVSFLFVGCAVSPYPQTAVETKLDAARGGQLSAAAAAVAAAKVANDSNPDGRPKTAVAGELGVAGANLPPASTADARAALARVNIARAGQLDEARGEWAEATAHAQALAGKISALEKQVAAERAVASVEARKVNERLCVLAALGAGGALFAAGALSLAAGMYFGLRKLEYGAAGLGLCSVLAFFAATQVGSPRFDLLAMLALAGGVGGLVFVVWSGFHGGSKLKAKAGGFERALSAIQKYADEAARRKPGGAKQLLAHLDAELDRAHKSLAADWDRLASFARAPAKN